MSEIINKTKVFADELVLIQNPKIKEFVTKCIENTPDYFYHVAASSTGKYHPEYSLGDGGLIRHTKALVFFAKELLSLEHNKSKFTEDERDIIIAAGILHDSFKHGKSENKYTITEHPLVAAQFVVDMSESNDDFIMKISSAIASHMGEWNTDYKTKKEVLPKPLTEIEKFLHECDYLASRKNVIVQLENYYNPNDYIIEDCMEIINEIIMLCRQKIADGYDRNKLIKIIAKNNHGNGNPRTIHTRMEAQKILLLIKEAI